MRRKRRGITNGGLREKAGEVDTEEGKGNEGKDRRGRDGKMEEDGRR